MATSAKEPAQELVMCTLSRFSRVRLSSTLWTVANQAPLSMGFSREEYWSGLLCPLPGNLPHPGIELVSLMSPFLAGGGLGHSVWGADLDWAQLCSMVSGVLAEKQEE